MWTQQDTPKLPLTSDLARAIVEKNVEQAGTIIEALTNAEPAKLFEQVMRQAIQKLPVRMKTSEGTLRSVQGYMKQVIDHAQKIARNPNSPSLNHML